LVALIQNDNFAIRWASEYGDVVRMAVCDTIDFDYALELASTAQN
jgi:hypothetical protein